MVYSAIPTILPSQKGAVAKCVEHCRQQIDSPWSSTFGKVHKALVVLRSGKAAPFKPPAAGSHSKGKGLRKGKGNRNEHGGVKGGSAAGGSKTGLDDETLLEIAAEYCMFFLGGSKWRAKQLHFEEDGDSDDNDDSDSDSSGGSSGDSSGDSSHSDHGCSNAACSPSSDGAHVEMEASDIAATPEDNQDEKSKKKKKKKKKKTKGGKSNHKMLASEARTLAVVAEESIGGKPSAKRQRIDTAASASTTSALPSAPSGTNAAAVSGVEAVPGQSTTLVEATAFDRNNPSGAAFDIIERRLPVHAPHSRRAGGSTSVAASSVSGRQLAGCLPWTGAIPWRGKLDVQDKRAVGYVSDVLR